MSTSRPCITRLFVFGSYVVEMLRDTFENWQSEFLQLLWQVVGR